MISLPRVLRAFGVTVFVLLLLAACGPAMRPTILTENKAGEVLQMKEVEKTGDRADIPQGEKEKDVVTTSWTHAGGNVAKVTTAKKGLFGKRQVYYNCSNCHKQSLDQLGVKTEQPKRSWYHWPLITLEALALVACIAALLYLRGLLAPVLTVIKGIFKWRQK